MQLRIKTPARLHLGILDLTGDLGRIYGSIGVAVEEPNLVLEAKESDSLNISGGDDAVNSLAKKFFIHYKIEPEIEINITERIPSHVGLGSGTQLSLALGTAITKIHGIDAGINDLARIAGRGSLSGIGIAAFEHGGFIVDAGRRVNSKGEVPPVIFRQPFPEDWEFIIAIPQTEKKVYGQQEKEAFRKIIPAPAGISADICRLLQIKLLPALIEKNIVEFGQSLTEIDRRVGLFFKDIQNGIYRERVSKQLVEFMLNNGFHGAGQSSWGPSVYTLAESKGAKEKESALREFMEKNGIPGEIITTKASNTGASINIL
ncbi:MAG: hypothetical protein KKE96_01890 [Candidatus Altiarchaeota archaeon]|nr:hypothetical protein [Candidatus Altiarchaeota archaeon]MBU4341882.1 hypothetical protein [Candidatus Altiarchaeota archaeon]